MFCEETDMNCFFRVGVEEEVEMLPYAGVRSVSTVLRIGDRLVDWIRKVAVFTGL
jgi:hypothetical protein